MTARSIVGVWTLALLATAAAVAAVVTSDHTDNKVATIALAAPTALAYVASGLVARARRPQNATGNLLILVGFTWLFGAWTSANSSVIHTAGIALSWVFIGVLAHLLLVFPRGRLLSRTDRVISGAIYVVVALGPLSVLLFDEGEITGGACGEATECPRNVLAVAPAQTVALVLALITTVAVGGLSLAVAVRMIQRWRVASSALRRSLKPVLITAVALIGAFAVQIAVGIVSEDLARVINWIVLGAMLAVPLAFLYGLLRPRLTAASRRLVAELSEERRPEQVQAVLQRELRDPTLAIGFRDHETGGYVGVDGRPLELPASGTGRAVTAIGEHVLVHDSLLSDQPELDEVVDAAQMALERGLSVRSLETSERRTRALLGAIPDNMYRLSRDGTYLDYHVRRRDPSSVYHTADTLRGRNVRDVMPAELVEPILATIERAYEEGGVQVLHYELGDHIEARFVRSGEDEVVVITRDITDLKQNEEALRALAHEQAALTRVAVAVATEQDSVQLFDIVSKEAAAVLGANAANLIRFERDGPDGIVVGRWCAEGSTTHPIGRRLVFDAPTAVAQVRETERPVRLRSTDTLGGVAGERLRELGVQSAIAAPIRGPGGLWGAVVLSSPERDAFTPDDEERLGNFANLVAVAVSNAEARDRVAALAEEQAALSRVAVAVAASRDAQPVFDVVTAEVGKLFHAQGANLVRFEEDPHTALVVGAWDDAQSHMQKGHRIMLDSPTPLAIVRQTGTTARVESFDEMPGETAAWVRSLGVASAVAAPVDVGGRRWGAVVVTSAERSAFDSEAEQRLAKFANLVALAIANTEAHEELTASRARIVRAGDEERQRLERNLHDGAQQRLVALSLALRLAQSKLDESSPARRLLEGASDELAQALDELRELARGIHPAILSDRGLVPALEALAARAPVPVKLSEITCGPLPPDVEAAAYYVVSESLTNVAKYAGANAAHVRVERENGFAVVEVEDDGVGGADPSRGTGLRGLADRVEALDGRLSVSSAAGRGTTVRAEIPLDGAG